MRFFKEAIISCVRVNVIETQLVSNLKAQETRNSQQVLVFVSQNRLWVQVHGFSAVMSKREITAKSDVIVKTLTLVQIHREHQQTHNSDIYTACSQRWRTSHGQKTGFCLAFFFPVFFLIFGSVHCGVHDHSVRDDDVGRTIVHRPLLCRNVTEGEKKQQLQAKNKKIPPPTSVESISGRSSLLSTCSV